MRTAADEHAADLLQIEFLPQYHRHLTALGFAPPVDVSRTYGIGVLVPNQRRRAGIYLLVLNDGRFYIGRAKDVVRRFAAHRKTFGERLIGFSFQEVAESKQPEIERALIQRGERAGLPLEQIEWVSQVYGTSDLDELVSPEELASWAADPVAHLATDNWPLPLAGEGRAGRDKRVIARFDEAPLVKTARELLALYVQHCVPLPRRTAPDYWNVACLPSTNASSYPRLFCVSAHVMETFVVGYEAGDPEAFWAFVVCARTPLTAEYGSLAKARRALGGVDIDEDRAYKSAGEDQCRLSFNDPETAVRIVRLPAVQDAARTLMHRIMRKGVNRYARYHCAPFAAEGLRSVAR